MFLGFNSAGSITTRTTHILFNMKIYLFCTVVVLLNVNTVGRKDTSFLHRLHKFESAFMPSSASCSNSNKTGLYKRRHEKVSLSL